MLCTVLYAWGISEDPGFFLSYLTYESLWLNICYFLLASILGADALLASPTRRRLLQHAGRARAHRVLGALLAIAVSFEAVVVVIFWVLLYPAMTATQQREYMVGNVLVHGLVLVAPWVDMVLGATRLHFRTAALVVLAAAAYLAVNAAVSRLVRPVYFILPWGQDTAADALVVAGVLLVLAVVFLIAASIAVACERAAEPGGRWAACGADAGATFSIAAMTRGAPAGAGAAKGALCVAGCAEGACNGDEETDPLCERSHYVDSAAEHLCGYCCAASSTQQEAAVEAGVGEGGGVP